MHDTLEFQFFTGSDWYTTLTSDSCSPGAIRLAMKDIQNAHPGKPVRVVDGSGRIVDML